MTRPLHVFSYKIKQQANGEADIFIDGDIVDAGTQSILKAWFGDETSTSYKSFRDQLNSVEASTFNVFINSGGGMVTDAMAIHDLIKDFRAKGKTVNTRGRGLIGSAATYILMAGDNPEMSKNSWFMVHNVSGAVYGDVNEVERYARTLRTFNDASRDFYSTATGMRKEDITKMMNEETWMTADTAKEKGFISKVTGEAAFSQSISRDNWPFSDTTVLNAYNSAVKKPATEENYSSQNLDQMKKFFQDLGNQIMNAIKGVKAPENNDHSVLMQSIGEAVNNSFNAAAEQMESAINDTVNTAVQAAVAKAKEGQEGAITSAVDAATKGMNDKITAVETANADLVKKNEDLEKDITNLKAGKNTTKEKGDEKVTEMVGKFD